MLNFLPLAATSAAAGSAATSSGASAAGSMGSMLITFVPLILIIVVFYFLMMRPQRKRDKETQQMRNNLQVGDEVVTVGGVIGRVVMIKEDSIVIETGADRNKMRIKKWAIQSCNTIHDENA